MLKVHNRNIQKLIVNFTYFTRYSSASIVDFELVNVGQEPVLWISIYPRAERHHLTNVFIINFKHISHLVLVILLLILSMYLIAGFDVLYLSRFYIKMNPSFIVYSFQKTLPRSGMHTSSLPRQNDAFITTLKQTVMQFFLCLIYLLISKVIWYLLIRARNAACKNRNC